MRACGGGTEEERERGGIVKGREKEGREGGKGERERGKEEKKGGVLFSPGWLQTCYGR